MVGQMARTRPVSPACRSFWRLYTPTTTGPGTPPSLDLGGLGASVGGVFERFWLGHKGALRERLPYLLVLLLGLALSISAYFLVQSLQHTNAHKAFEGPAGRYATAIPRVLDSNLEVVKSAGSFFSAAKNADRWDFFQFARDALPRHPAIQALEWIPRVSAAERAKYEGRALDDGLFGFKFFELDAAGKTKSSTPKTEYYPIYYVEPFLQNETSLGFDLAADPEQLAALESARDSGHLVVARSPADGMGAAAVGQDSTSFMVILPVYETNVVPEGRSERRAKLMGFMRGRVRLDALVEGARLQQSGAADLDIAILNHSNAGGRTIFALPVPEAGVLKSEPSDLVLVNAHEVGDQRWSIVVTPGQSWQLPSTGIDPWSVLVVGLLLTALLLQYLITAWERTRVIEKAVTARTAELCVVNGTLAQEISERKQAELDLRAAKEKVEIASRAKSEFLAMMGHELRTPLNAVIGFADILTNETFGPLGEVRYRDYAADIGRSGGDLLQIINDILDLTKIETGEFDMPEESLDITELVAIVCEAASEKASQAGLSLEIKAEQNTPPLKGSSQAVKRVLEVLLSNALKFTPQDGQVAVTCGIDGTGGIVIEVADNGIGIAPQDQERVFQPFTQVDQTLSRSHQGTGLGLTLAQRLMELHGGALKLESQLGDGTKIRALFPAKRSLPPEKPEEAQKATKPKATGKAKAPGKAA